MKKIISIIIVCTILKGILLSQPYLDILKIQYYTFGESGYVNQDTRLQSNEFWSELALPIEIKRIGYFYTGVTYNRIHLVSSDADVPEQNLNGLTIPLGVIHTWKNEKWTTMFILSPRLSSDFKHINSDHVQLTNVMVNYVKKNDNLTWSFGYFLNTEYYGLLVLPLAGVEWKLNNRTHIFCLLPDNFNLEYKVNTKFYSGLSYRICTTSYRLSEDNEAFYVIDGDKLWGHHQAKFFMDFYPAKNIVFNFDVGHTFLRQYQKFDNNHKLIKNDPLFSDFKDGFFLKLGLAYRIRMDNAESE